MNFPINIRIDGSSKNQRRSQEPPEFKSGKSGKIFLRIKFKSGGKFSEFNESEGMFQPVKDSLPILGNDIDNPGDINAETPIYVWP